MCYDVYTYTYMVPPPWSIGGRGTTTFWCIWLSDVIFICMFALCDVHARCFASMVTKCWLLALLLPWVLHSAPDHLPICKPSPTACTCLCCCSLSATGTTWSFATELGLASCPWWGSSCFDQPTRQVHPNACLLLAFRAIWKLHFAWVGDPWRRTVASCGSLMLWSDCDLLQQLLYTMPPLHQERQRSYERRARRSWPHAHLPSPLCPACHLGRRASFVQARAASCRFRAQKLQEQLVASRSTLEELRSDGSWAILSPSVDRLV